MRPCRPLPLRPLFEEGKGWNESYDRRRGYGTLSRTQSNEIEEVC